MHPIRLVSYIKSTYIPQLNAQVEALERRLLPTFDDIDQEATRVRDETLLALEGFGSSEGHGEIAFAKGLEHYEMLSGIRQGLINMFASGLYHLFEQQVQEMNSRFLQQGSSRYISDIMKAWERGLGRNVLAQQDWNCLNELRLLANTVKHGDGDSSKDLHSVNPDLFHPPVARDFELLDGVLPRKPPVYKPMIGEDIYATLEDVKRYHTQVVAIWSAFDLAFQSAPQN